MLEKVVKVDLIEVVENGIVQVRTVRRIVEDGVFLSHTYHRHTIAPGEDYTQEDARVRAVCAAVHAPEVIEAYALQQEVGHEPLA